MRELDGVGQRRVKDGRGRARRRRRPVRPGRVRPVTGRADAAAIASPARRCHRQSGSFVRIILLVVVSACCDGGRRSLSQSTTGAAPVRLHSLRGRVRLASHGHEDNAVQRWQCSAVQCNAVRSTMVGSVGRCEALAVRSLRRSTEPRPSAISASRVTARFRNGKIRTPPACHQQRGHAQFRHRNTCDTC